MCPVPSILLDTADDSKNVTVDNWERHLVKDCIVIKFKNIYID